MTYPMAPGLTFTQWDRADARGTIRAYLMTAQLGTPGLSLDYLGAEEVPERDDVLDMVVADAAIGGINGDFFDISDTGAPLGIGADRDRGLLHGRTSGWNEAFYVDKAGAPQIGDLEVKASVKGHPELKVEYVNSPTVFPKRVGVYTPEWGRTAGSRVVDGQKKNVREVVVEKGRVVRNRTKLSNKAEDPRRRPVGRDKMAKRLAKLKVGSKVKVKYKLAGRPPVALTGNKQLVDERIRTVVDDREMHPRTAIGIDRDTNSVLMLVIDGRQTFSRGYTMVELANLMIELGAEDALNLDGGGSSTMVGLRPDGALGVLNSAERRRGQRPPRRRSARCPTVSRSPTPRPSPDAEQAATDDRDRVRRNVARERCGGTTSAAGSARSDRFPASRRRGRAVGGAVARRDAGGAAPPASGGKAGPCPARSARPRP